MISIERKPGGLYSLVDRMCSDLKGGRARPGNSKIIIWAESGFSPIWLETMLLTTSKEPQSTTVGRGNG